MIRRNIEQSLRRLASLYPVITLTGPRQSGKTTLCRSVFADKSYFTFEAPDVRARALADPRTFLAGLDRGAVFDEVQRVPDLLSYLQGEVDTNPTKGRFILTGSQNFALMERITQTLAGRTGLLHLLPLSHSEIGRFEDGPTDLWDTVWHGGYPRIHNEKLPPNQWLADYVATYVERDVRSLTNVTNLEAFMTFLRLCAGRTAQELALSQLGSDSGISQPTARSWLAILEASYIVFRLPPWLTNPRKRLIRTPKLHFVDTGLVCYLLGIHKVEHLREHPLRGAIFETFVASEIRKAFLNAGAPAALFHMRQTQGLEVDIIVDAPEALYGVECKSGATVVPEFTRALQTFSEENTTARGVRLRLAHGGDVGGSIGGVELCPWATIDTLDWGMA